MIEQRDGVTGDSRCSEIVSFGDVAGRLRQQCWGGRLSMTASAELGRESRPLMRERDSGYNI